MNSYQVSKEIEDIINSHTKKMWDILQSFNESRVTITSETSKISDNLTQLSTELQSIRNKVEEIKNREGGAK